MLNPLSVADVISMSRDDDNFLIIDTRPAKLFARAFIPGSVFLGLEGDLESWATALLPTGQNILLVAEKGREDEAMKRLTQAGFNSMIGYLHGVDEWRASGEETDLLIEVEADELLLMDLPFDDHLVILDVRSTDEFEKGHLEEAENLPLASLRDPGSMAMIEDTDNIYVHSEDTYRSIIACTLFKRQGIHNVRYVNGGWKAIKEAVNERDNA